MGADEWVQKVDTLLKEWTLLDNTVNELNNWVAKDKSAEGENQFSLEKMESTFQSLRTSSRRRRSWLTICKKGQHRISENFQQQWQTSVARVKNNQHLLRKTRLTTRTGI